MILIDFGNTRFKWQVRGPGGEIQVRGAGYHERGQNLTELVAVLGGEARDREPVWVASVVGDELEQTLVRELARWRHTPSRIVFIKPEAAKAGVRSGYEDPARLGADRWAALIGAWRLSRSASLVLSLGTAITLDVLDAEGLHRGGLIVPGRLVLARALAAATAQLPEVDMPGSRSLGQNTESAMANGCQFMIEGFIESADECIGRTLNIDPVRILTGGDAGTLGADLRKRWRHEPDLVFDGLATLAWES
ncbi:MAG: type III pantothenate kinase [Gammaproteobacteria bacterium]